MTALRALPVKPRRHKVLRVLADTVAFPNTTGSNNLCSRCVFADAETSVAHKEDILFPRASKLVLAVTTQDFQLHAVDRKTVGRKEANSREVLNQQLSLPFFNLPRPKMVFGGPLHVPG